MAEILTSNLSHVSSPALMLSLILLLAQCGPHNTPNTKVRAESEQPAELRELLRQGNAFYRSGEYLQAIPIYQKGYTEAKRLGSMQSAVKFLNNLGSAHYEMFHYREAIQAYLKNNVKKQHLSPSPEIIQLSIFVNRFYSSAGAATFTTILKIPVLKQSFRAYEYYLHC